MAYTLHITDGTTTYDFAVQPEFQREFAFEYNEKRTPPTLKAELETWLLKNAMYTSATEASVTTDFETLRALLSDALTPITKVIFKRNGSQVWALDSTTSHLGGVMVRSFGSTGGPGQFANHWQGDLAFVGRRLLPDGDGIVSVSKRLTYSYDAAGLATVRLSGEVETEPGTSAEEAARALALTSPGSAYGLITQGPDDEPNVEVQDPDDDTKATFESVWKEHAVSLPAGVNEYDLGSETSELPDGGERVVITVRAKGPTAAQLRTAVRAQKPAERLTEATEREDEAHLEYAATYSQEQPSARTQARWGGSVIQKRVEVSIDGGFAAGTTERDLEPVLIPGFPPVFVPRPRSPVTVTERVMARLRGEPSALADFGVGPILGGVGALLLQPGQSRPPVVRLEREGLTPDGDVWAAEAAYSYLAVEVDADAIAQAVIAEMGG